mmetsp:Transcript_21729/g.32349  ORF Transcript_21729/g.32349 Transcript_21729/m.32349 type:complete len:92 (+) Transcript_21729:133-408(+)
MDPTNTNLGKFRSNRGRLLDMNAAIAQLDLVIMACREEEEEANSKPSSSIEERERGHTPQPHGHFSSDKQSRVPQLHQHSQRLPDPCFAHG